MWVDLPPVTSAEIWSEFQKPLSQEVVSVWFCKSPDFQKQFDELQTQTKEKTAKLQEEMQYSEKQKEVLRKIYCSLWEENPELKSAIETQSVKVFEVPNRDLVAVSIDWKNVDYLYDLEGGKDNKFSKAIWLELKDFLQKINELSAFEQKQKMRIDWIKEKFNFANLDNILKNDFERSVLFDNIKENWGYLNEDNSITIWWEIYNKWDLEYKNIVNNALESDIKTMLILFDFLVRKKKESLWL